MNWTEHSFVLKPSVRGDIGVFATHDIPAGTPLFSKEGHALRKLKVKDVPKELMEYCTYINDEECWCPERFDRLEIGWFIKHSATPNVATKGEQAIDATHHIKPNFYALQGIKAGDEIVMDYNQLNEPEHLKNFN